MPTIDAGQFQGEADAGKVVIDLASAGASPAAVPVVPTIDGGKLTPGNSARQSSTWQAPGPPRGRARADDRRREADGGQGGHPAAVIDLATCRGPRGADDRRRETDAGQGGHPAAVIDLATCRGPRGADVPPVVPTIDGGKLTAGNSARRSSTWQTLGPFRGRARAARGADVPPRSPWCRRSTPASPRARRSSCRPWCRRSTAGSVPSPGKLVIDLGTCCGSRGANDRRRPVPRESRLSCRPWCRRAARADDRRREACRVRASWLST